MDHLPLVEKLLNALFVSTHFRAGYDEAEVDTFIDEIVRRVRSDEDPSRVVADIQAQGFSVVSMRRGYEMREVDTFLEEVCESLVPGSGADLDPAPDATPGGTDARADQTSALIGERPGLAARALRALRGN